VTFNLPNPELLKHNYTEMERRNQPGEGNLAARNDLHAASSEITAVQANAGPSARPPRRARSGWQAV